MIRSALALLLSAMQMTLPGRGTGGSHSKVGDADRGRCVELGRRTVEDQPLHGDRRIEQDGPAVIARPGDRDPLGVVHAYRSQLHQLASEAILGRLGVSG